MFSSGAFTVSAWVKSANTVPGGGYSNVQNIVGFPSNNVGHLAIIHTTGKLAYWDYGASAWKYGNTPLTSNQWYHVVLVFDGDDGAFLYLNGLADSAEQSWGGTAAQKRCTVRYIGAQDPSRYFNGQIANTQIYNRALTQAEIKQNFEAQAQRFKVPRWGNRAIIQDSLDAWFDAGIPESYPGSGSTWYDISGNDKDYTITLDTGGGFSATYGGLIDFGSGTTGSGAFYASASDSIFNVATSTATMSFWVRKKATSSNGSDIFTMDRDDANGVRIYMTPASSGSIYFSTNGQSDQLVAGTTFYQDIWYNIVCTLDSTEKKIYINGALDGSQTVAATTISRSGSCEDSIGDLGCSASNGYQFKGDFASAVFYRRALTADEVNQNFTVQRQRFRI